MAEKFVEFKKILLADVQNTVATHFPSIVKTELYNCASDSSALTKCSRNCFLSSLQQGIWNIKINQYYNTCSTFSTSSV
jgi:hypothetical protein